MSYSLFWIQHLNFSFKKVILLCDKHQLYMAISNKQQWTSTVVIIWPVTTFKLVTFVFFEQNKPKQSATVLSLLKERAKFEKSLQQKWRRPLLPAEARPCPRPHPWPVPRVPRTSVMTGNFGCGAITARRLWSELGSASSMPRLRQLRYSNPWSYQVSP